MGFASLICSKNSLRFKVTASLCAVLVIVYSALLLAETRLVTRELDARRRRSSQMVCMTVERSLRDAMMKRRQPEVAAIISSVTQLPDIRGIAILDEDGRHILGGISESSVEDRVELRRMLENAASSGRPVSQGLRGDILRTVSPIPTE